MVIRQQTSGRAASSALSPMKAQRSLDSATARKPIFPPTSALACGGAADSSIAHRQGARRPSGPATRDRFAGPTCALLQLLQRRDGICLIFRAVAGEVTHELPSDGDTADAAKADSGIAEGADDLRSQARPIRAFDPDRV